MKKITYLFIAFSIIFTSCGDDDYSIAYVDDEVKTDLVGTVSVSTSSAFNGEAVEVTYSLPQSFTVESTLEVEIKSTLLTLPVSPNIERLLITVPAGTTTGTESFSMPNFDNVAPFNGIAEFLSVSLTGIALTQPETGSIADPFTMSSDSSPIDLFQANGSLLRPRFNVLMMSLDWEGPYGGGENDFDLAAYDAGFTIRYENSASGSRFEGDFFNNPANEDHPDGDYIFEISSWTTVSADPVPYRLHLTHPDGTADVYEGNLDPAIGYVEFAVSQTTDGDGVRTFTTAAIPTTKRSSAIQAKINKFKSKI
jgi:hypothetical protein